MIFPEEDKTRIANQLPDDGDLFDLLEIYEDLSPREQREVRTGVERRIQAFREWHWENDLMPEPPVEITTPGDGRGARIIRKGWRES